MCGQHKIQVNSYKNTGGDKTTVEYSIYPIIDASLKDGIPVASLVILVSTVLVLRADRQTHRLRQNHRCG